MTTVTNEVVLPDSCSICMDKFTNKLRKCIKCPYCHENICLQCLEKYLLSSIDDPHCVHCRRGWSQSLLQMFCTKTFLVKTYAEYRANILLNRSKSLLPRYQDQAEKVKAAEKFLNKNVEINNKITEIRHQISKLIDEQNNKINVLWREYTTNDIIANEIKRGQRDLEGNLINIDSSDLISSSEDKQEKKKFIRRCPAEGCNGYLTSVWKCGLCSNWTCPECFVVKGTDKHAEHNCRDDDKATANEIRKSTKPCPNCGEVIQKAEGCDQMFCTACNSPFSWKSGEIIKSGIIHNPHYFEWLQRNGGTIGARHHLDIPCGGLPAFHEISRRLHELGSAYDIENKNTQVRATTTDNINTNKRNNFSSRILMLTLTDAYRASAHMIDFERQRWIAHTVPEDNTDLYIQFLLNKITEDELKNQLKLNERVRIRSKEIRELIDAFTNAAIDIWRQILGDITDEKVNRNNFRDYLIDWLNQLDRLILFVNPPLLAISHIYNCQVPQITDDYKNILTSVSKIRKEERKKQQKQLNKAKIESV